METLSAIEMLKAHLRRENRLSWVAALDALTAQMVAEQEDHLRTALALVERYERALREIAGLTHFAIANGVGQAPVLARAALASDEAGSA